MNKTTVDYSKGLKTWWKCTKCSKELLLYDEVTTIHNGYYRGSTHTHYEVQAFWFQHTCGDLE